MENFRPEKLYKKRIQYLLVPLVGVGIGLFYLTFANNNDSLSPLFYITHSVFSTLGLWIGCYSITTFLWKKYPWEQHPKKHIIIQLVSILIYTNVFSYFQFILAEYSGLVSNEELYGSLPYDIILINLITLFITLIHEAIFFYKQWKYNFSKSARLEKENIQAQYENLKAQINPHFLFNSLNSLSVLTEDNEKAQEYIEDLSDFLRYGLQNKSSELVHLNEELEIVNKFISIQKARFQDNLQININVNSTDNWHVPPLAIQLLVENSIKHNIVSQEKPLTISITQHSNFIKVCNNLQLRIQDETTQKGLVNLEHRYSFLSTQKVVIEQNEKQFCVTIPLLKLNT